MLTLKQGPKYPQPDWARECSEAKRLDLKGAELEEFWNERGKEWMRLLAPSLGPAYLWMESAHFWLLSSQDQKTSNRIISWAEHAYARLTRALGDLGDGICGHIPILVVPDLDKYYEYISDYVSDGEHAFSGGVYLYRGYGHFVFCYHDLASAESVIAHELAHALLLALPIPLWLNEGIAQLAEIDATGRHPSNQEKVRETIGTFWTPQTIQEFWRGESFDRQDEGQIQSYHLALVLTRKLTRDMVKFRVFAREASRLDSGQAAMRTVYGVGLEDLVSDYLGDGHWAPMASMQQPEAKPVPPGNCAAP